MELYPLKFNPVFSYRIWGGKKLKTVLNKIYNEESIGESWEISDIKNNETSVSEGDLKGKTLKQLIKTFKGNFVGNHVYDFFGNDFPLLIKFIDAKEPLSIQVHPGDSLAKKRHNSFGKNEMWYVMQAEKDAELIIGFNQKTTKKIYGEYLKNSSLCKLLNVEKVKKGDVYYIPTGRIHAIGAGVLLAEIQQTSNITYRIYDYNRIDTITGGKRALHNDLALDAIDFKFHKNYKTIYSLQTNISTKLVHSPYFKTNIISIKGELTKNYSKLDSFIIYICVEGNLEVEYKNKFFSLNMGETLLLPAIINQVKLKSPYSCILEVFL
ncbi:type I phosphomannose isomerase catalytic subunit [Lutibacter sp.]|uniref:type I phosphomannose isomerase catalytic subunit n=1 Tax=Lutibacter sp. TaxID=1925666 RepID=UPI0025C3D1B5|nr:type I phosphomannose isomerase catalytic subunit [Lutibacter sp.]MCF6167233.1 class I mannose-6-phosphate isomerase [Lutibacter sp.]